MKAISSEKILVFSVYYVNGTYFGNNKYIYIWMKWKENSTNEAIEMKICKGPHISFNLLYFKHYFFVNKYSILFSIPNSITFVCLLFLCMDFSYLDSFVRVLWNTMKLLSFANRKPEKRKKKRKKLISCYDNDYF